MINKFKKTKSLEKNGFTVLFAVIVASLVLALGLGIVAITMKEVRLSGAGRDSQLAFYAADSGLECAMYADLVSQAFATSSDSTDLGQLKCNNQVIELTETLAADNALYKFKMFMEYNGATGDETKPCVDVEVRKYLENSEAKTSIDARGYNTCVEGNARRLERGYSVIY